MEPGGPCWGGARGEGCPQPLPTAVWSRATSQGLPNQSSGFVFPGQHFQCTSPPGNPLPLVEKQSRPASEHFLLDQNPSHAPWFPNGSGSVARLRADIANLGSVLGDCVTVDSREPDNLRGTEAPSPRRKFRLPRRLWMERPQHLHTGAVRKIIRTHGYMVKT